MYAQADNITGFTGVLVQRQHKPGQKHVQLLFQTTNGFRLSITRNPQLVRTLKEGNTYKIKGPEYMLGQKVYIDEPTALLVQPKKGIFKNYIGITTAILVLVVLVGGVSAKVLSSHDSPISSQPEANNNSSGQSQQTRQVPVSPKVESASTTQDQTQPTPAASTPTKKSTSKTNKSTTPSVSATQQEPVNNPTQPANETPITPAAPTENPQTPPADQTPPPETPPSDPPAETPPPSEGVVL